jgi:aspartyl aminopeptidase
MSWGFEDNERISRLQKLNHQVSRVPGLLFHLNHQRGANSVPENPYYQKNMQEYYKINSMNKNQLEEYIKNWGWV